MKFFRKWNYNRKKRSYEKWAAEFAKKWDLPYAGVLMLAGYRFTK